MPAMAEQEIALAMYERAGFREVARRQANRATVERPIVRRRLRPR